MKFKEGDRIRRKQHKHKTRTNTHPIVTLHEFIKTDINHNGKNVVSRGVTLIDSNGDKSWMSEKGLDWYEKVED